MTKSELNNIKKQFGDKKLIELAAIYNKMVPKSKRVKRFSDKATAIERITKAFSEDSNKTIIKENKATAAKNTAAKKDLATDTKKLKVKTNKGHSLEFNLTATKEVTGMSRQKQSQRTDSTKLEEKSNIPKITLVGRKSQHTGKRIYKLTEENPRRRGSHGHINWNIYVDGMTYEEYIISKGGAHHLAWDLEKGYVELRD